MKKQEGTLCLARLDEARAKAEGDRPEGLPPERQETKFTLLCSSSSISRVIVLPPIEPV